MKVKPYIGITGPVSIGEVRAIGHAFTEKGCTMESNHIPMIGILVSHKTLNYNATTNLRYPPFQMVPELVKEAGKYSMPMIHYNTRSRDTLVDQVSEMIEGLGVPLEGIQLNMAWPDPEKVRQIKRDTNLKIVIQVSTGAMQDLSHKEVADRVKPYEDHARYLLIDPSGGKGKEFNLEDSIALYHQLNEQVPKMMIGFAGGFRGINVIKRVRELKEKLKTDRFCIDAEGGLRDKITDAYGDDLFNLEKARSYIEGASLVLR